MPVYRLTPRTAPVALLEADSARIEGIHTVLRGTRLPHGPGPREVVVRRVPRSVEVEVVDGLKVEDRHSVVDARPSLSRRRCRRANGPRQRCAVFATVR